MRNRAINVRLPDDLYEAAVAYAAETQRTPANLLQHALAELLSKRSRWSMKTATRRFPRTGKGSLRSIDESVPGGDHGETGGSGADSTTRRAR